MTACVVRLARAEMTAPGLAQLRLDRLDNPGSLPNGCRVFPASRGDFPATTGGLGAVADSRLEFAWRLHWLAFRKQWSMGCSLQSPAPHIISQRRGKEGGRVGARLFSAVRHPPPTQPLIRRASSDRQLWGTLGRKLTTLFRPDVTVRGSFCSRSPFICSSCVIFYFRPHPSRMQLVKLGVCGGSTDTVGRLQRHLSFSLLHIAHEWVHKPYIYLVDARSQLCVPLLCGRGTWGLDAAARG